MLPSLPSTSLFPYTTLFRSDMEELESDTADWIAHPKGEERCFWFGDGSICTKNPDMATLDKMLQLSKTLNACVRGDDGETYRRSDRKSTRLNYSHCSISYAV